jgi:hypothetical protein
MGFERVGGSWRLSADRRDIRWFTDTDRETGEYRARAVVVASQVSPNDLGHPAQVRMDRRGAADSRLSS